MTRTRMLVLPVGDERCASTRHRILAHLPALREAGFDSRVRHPLRLGSGPLRRAGRLLDLARDGFTTSEEPLWWIQRKTYPPPFDRRLRRPGRTIVFDMDDAIDLPPPSRAADPATVRRYRRNFEATVHAADLVLCGNRNLAARLPHERFALIETPIDTRRFHPEAIGAQRTGKTLGWVGHSDNLRYLESLADPLRELSRRHAGLRLIVVADRPPVLPGVDLEFRRWSLDREVDCFSGIDIGLMPLDDTPWARGKCAFKAIQYMALGLPAVASPVGMTVDVIEDGVSGLLASTPEQWVDALDALLSDPQRASAMGTAGLGVVRKSYSLEAVSERLIGSLSAALRGDRSGRATRSSSRLHSSA